MVRSARSAEAGANGPTPPSADDQQPPNDTNIPYSANPPGPILQYINTLLHIPPVSFLVYGIFWSIFLIILSPCAGLVLIFITWWKLARYLVLLMLGMDTDGPKISPHVRTTTTASDKGSSAKVELAVLITGCDSGFGCDLTFDLAQRGFIVFAGCLADNAMDQFEERAGIIPLKMDVTNEKEVEGAVAMLMNWLAEGTIKGTERRFHALVNNAGIGTGGRIDWLDLQAYRLNMEVNYFGMIRTSQACLPILKSQAISGSYSRGRIINMVSMAGLIAMGDFGPYSGSKFAAEAFSTSLRHELEAFGIQVATVNPSFHTSLLTDRMGPNFLKKWQSLDERVKREYGEAFFRQQFYNNVEQPRSVMWNASNVRDQLVYCIETTNLPPQVAVGMDAKYSILPLRHLPIWLQDMLLYTFARSRRVKPAVMEGVGM